MILSAFRVDDMRTRIPDDAHVKGDAPFCISYERSVALARQCIVDCFQVGQRQIVERLAIYGAHRFDAVAATCEAQIDPRSTSRQASRQDGQTLMSRAKTLLLVSVLSLAVASCGGGGDSGTSTAPGAAPGQTDTTPPSAPAGLVATAAGASVVNLTWSASTDNVGVTGYVVRRDGVEVGTSTTTSYADTGLSGATTYTYTVAARDAAGNVSPESTIASATTTDTICALDTRRPCRDGCWGRRRST